MKNYKLIILGPQCSGKTTLTRFLRNNNSNLPIVEEDELFVELNGGEYPHDVEFKENKLRQQLEEKIRQSNNVIFITSYLNPIILKELKSKGFKVAQLVLSKEEFQKRNEKRMRDDGYADANTWAKEVFGFHEDIKSEGLADKSIDAELKIEDIAQEVFELLES